MNRINNNSGKNKLRSKKEYIEKEIEDDIKKTKKAKTKKQLKEEKKNIKIAQKEAKREARKKKIRNFLLKILFLLIFIIIVLGVLFYNKIEQNGGGIKGTLITVLGLSVENVNELKPINVLLLGMSEDINAKLTDTIIVCSYNPKNQSASMISIPRDTFIGKDTTQAKGNDKINTLYYKDSEKLLKTVSTMLGVDIDYYALVKTQALIEIVDIVGGVDFEVPINMDYDDPTQDLHIHLKQGMQKIDGKKAEQLLRFRHNNDGSSYPANYGDNDYGRMKTQRTFITETIKQTIDFKNVLKTKSIINTVFENIETNIVLEEIIQYLPTVVGFEFDSIVNYQLPGISEKCNNIWLYVQDKKETEELIETLKLTK